MKPHVIFVGSNDGFVHMSTDDLMNIVNKVYDDGFIDGRNSVVDCTQLQSPYCTYSTEVTCGDDIPDQK